MPNPTINLICFDLGCVLIEICADMPEALRRAGVHVPNSGEPALRRQVAEVMVRQETGVIDTEGYAREVAAIVGITPAQAIATMTAWLKRPFPGVCELIEELRLNDSVQLACLSNTNALHWSIMTANTGPCTLPLHRLHHRFASQLIGCMKPDAGIYQHVEDATAVDPARILFFDDRPENCQAARVRGWTAHEIALDGDPVAQMRTHLEGHGIL